MRSRRVTYLPITSIVVVIIILVVAVAVISYRDIGRGREQISEMLWYQARGILTLSSSSLRAEIASPDWRPSQVQQFFREVSDTHPGISYLALLEGRRVVIHSDAGLMGSDLPDAEHFTEAPREAHDLRPHWLPGGRGPMAMMVDLAVGTRTVEVGGRRVYEYRVSFDVPPADEIAERMQGAGRGRNWPPGQRTRERVAPDPEALRERLSELVGRPVASSEPVTLTAVVGLDAADLEAAIRSTRNFTLALALILMLVGGAAIYFLFVVATYRSTKTALENMRSYTSNIIESMTSGLLSFDAHARVATVNAGARSILALGDGDVAGRTADEVLRFEDASHAREMSDVLGGRRDKAEVEARVTVGDESVPVAVSASLLRDEEGERAGTVVLFQDLREIEELKEAVERERHLASLGRLAAGVAHEVRNPLSSLKGFAQFFRAKFAPGSEEERYSDIMIEEVERLDRVVQELLDFARPVAPSLKPTAPNSLIEEALALVSEDAQFRRVTVERRLPDGLPDVLVDPMQMRQAMLNVFLNAIEAMGDGGTMTVETSESRSPDGARSVTLAVADTGPGMTTEEMDKLFEPFYTTKPKGTGLGMTVVSRVVEQNGGRVLVKSAPGEGTTLTFVLPVAGRE